MVVEKCAASADADDNPAAAIFADRKRLIAGAAPKREIIALHKAFTAYRLVLLQDRHHWIAWAAVEIDARQRLLDVQLAGLAGLGIDPAPVVQPKGHVAGLLNLEEH